MQREILVKQFGATNRFNPAPAKHEWKPRAALGSGAGCNEGVARRQRPNVHRAVGCLFAVRCCLPYGAAPPLTGQVLTHTNR